MSCHFQYLQAICVLMAFALAMTASSEMNQTQNINTTCSNCKNGKQPTLRIEQLCKNFEHDATSKESKKYCVYVIQDVNIIPANTTVAPVTAKILQNSPSSNSSLRVDGRPEYLSKTPGTNNSDQEVNRKEVNATVITEIKLPEIPTQIMGNIVEKAKTVLKKILSAGNSTLANSTSQHVQIRELEVKNVSSDLERNDSNKNVTSSELKEQNVTLPKSANDLSSSNVTDITSKNKSHDNNLKLQHSKAALNDSREEYLQDKSYNDDTVANDGDEGRGRRPKFGGDSGETERPLKKYEDSIRHSAKSHSEAFHNHLHEMKRPPANAYETRPRRMFSKTSVPEESTSSLVNPGNPLEDVTEVKTNVSINSPDSKKVFLPLAESGIPIEGGESEEKRKLEEAQRPTSEIQSQENQAPRIEGEQVERKIKHPSEGSNDATKQKGSFEEKHGEIERKARPYVLEGKENGKEKQEEYNTEALGNLALGQENKHELKQRHPVEDQPEREGRHPMERPREKEAAEEEHPVESKHEHQQEERHRNQGRHEQYAGKESRGIDLKPDAQNGNRHPILNRHEEGDTNPLRNTRKSTPKEQPISANYLPNYANYRETLKVKHKNEEEDVAPGKDVSKSEGIQATEKNSQILKRGKLTKFTSSIGTLNSEIPTEPATEKTMFQAEKDKATNKKIKKDSRLSAGEDHKSISQSTNTEDRATKRKLGRRTSEENEETEYTLGQVTGSKNNLQFMDFKSSGPNRKRKPRPERKQSERRRHDHEDDEMFYEESDEQGHRDRNQFLTAQVIRKRRIRGHGADTPISRHRSRKPAFPELRDREGGSAIEVANETVSATAVAELLPKTEIKYDNDREREFDLSIAEQLKPPLQFIIPSEQYAESSTSTFKPFLRRNRHGTTKKTSVRIDLYATSPSNLQNNFAGNFDQNQMEEGLYYSPNNQIPIEGSEGVPPSLISGSMQDRAGDASVSVESGSYSKELPYGDSGSFSGEDGSGESAVADGSDGYSGSSGSSESGPSLERAPPKPQRNV